MNTLLLASAASLLAIAPYSAPDTDGCSASRERRETSVRVMDIVDTAVAAGSFETLATALTHANLIDTLKGEGPFTVFAPTDEAFAALPKGTLETLLEPKNMGTLTSILTYHVVPGEVTANKVVKLPFAGTVNGQRLGIHFDEGKVMIGGAEVVTTDIQCTNGVIHVIDAVMLPESQNIVEKAAAAGTFNTLIAAAKAAGLAEALMGDGPLTVLAPTDEAFAKLPAGTVEALLKPENKHKLADILKAHVISGRVFADQAIKAGTAKTLQGFEAKATIVDGRLNISGANVIASDIQVSNGVIHAIDTVLIP